MHWLHFFGRPIGIQNTGLCFKKRVQIGSVFPVKDIYNPKI